MKNRANTSSGMPSTGKRILILIAALFTAIAVSVTFAVCFGYEKPVGGSIAAVSGDPQTSTYYTRDYSTASNYIYDGQIISDLTAGNYYSIKLPRGSYKFEAYGGKGANGSGGGAGGLGGYTYATYNITTDTAYIYVYVGTQGSGVTGGNSGGYTSGGSTSGHGGGGGGATYFSLTNRALQSHTAAERANIIIVAGGGGGSQSRAGGAGGGGNRNGSRCPSSSYGYGGCGGGLTGPHGDPMNSHTTSADGTFGVGGSGVRGSDSYYGGAGGGGYWGGCGTQTDVSQVDDKGGGGGSGYIMGGLSGGGTNGGNSSANGSAKITAISVNTAPTTKNFTVASGNRYNRGDYTSSNISVASHSIAQDPDYVNLRNSSANATWVYYTAGNTSNYDTMPEANAGLFLDAACSKVASSYLNWSWASNQDLRITKILRYPRTNVDGQADGVFTLYTRVRDAFNSNTKRGVSVISFKLNVNENAISANKTTSNATYRVGVANTNNANENFLGNSNLYHTQIGTKVIFLPKPIAPSDTNAYTINASDVYSDGDSAYDSVAFKSVGAPAIAAQSNYYSITYNSNANYATGLYPSISIKATGTRPPSGQWIILQVTAQSSENATKLGIGSTSTDVYLVFKVANTRPYYAGAVLNTKNQQEPFARIDLNAAQKYVDIRLGDMVWDIDEGNNATSLSFVQGATTNSVKVPTKEYVSVDYVNNSVDLKSSSNYYGKTSINTASGAMSSVTGEGTDNTGFDTGSVVPLGSSDAATANVMYSFVDSKTIRFTGRTATQYQYSTVGRTGHLYVLVHVTDPADTADSGIWFPIAIEVLPVKPSATTPIANFTLSFTGATQSSDAAAAVTGDPSYEILTPISYIDSNGVVQGIGKENKDISDVGHAKPFTIDTDTFAYPDTNATTSAVKSRRALNDFALLYSSSLNDIVVSRSVYTEANFFRIETITLWASKSVFAKVPQSSWAQLGITLDGELCSFLGLKITAVRATDDKFLQVNINVKDSHGTSAAVPILIKVNNRALSKRRNPDSGTDKINAITGTTTPYGTYVHNASLNANVVEYMLENTDVVQVTPYDFAYDYDVDPENNIINPTVSGSTTFNSNPKDSGFAAMVGRVYKTYNIAVTDSPNVPATVPSANGAGITAQTLSFANPDSIISNASQYSHYIRVEVLNVCTVGSSSYSVPCIKVEGLSRTTSAIVQLRFNITDGFSSVECMFTVKVRNSSPTLKYTGVLELTANRSLDSTICPNSKYFVADGVHEAEGLAYDKDNDSPTFIYDSAKVVAKVGDEYFEALDADLRGVALGATGVKYKLSDFVEAKITKNSNGVDALYVAALSATQTFSVPIFVQFRVQDGFRSQMGVATLYLPVNVLNSAPTFTTENLLLTNETNREYSWNIPYNVKPELKQTRYIANCKELAESSVLNVPSANKTWLFDDADAQQHAILNPKTYNDAENIVGQFNNRTNPQDPTLVNNPITAAAFDNYPNKAILYTQMYPAATGADNDYTNGKYLEVTVVRFKKTDTGFVKLEAADGSDARQNAEYWAIQIVDKDPTGRGNFAPMQIAIAVKDNHHGKTIYNAVKSTDPATQSTGESALTVTNFYYNYREPGLRAMHTYYRTDPNVDASTQIVREGTTDKYYVLDAREVDEKGVDKYLKNKADQDRYGAAPNLAAKQEILKTAEFQDNVRYRYFVKTLSNGDETYKHFSTPTFAFEPISVVGGQESKTQVPMSYIAMPGGVVESTNAGTHVVFANVELGSNVTTGKLSDDGTAYLSWGSAASKNLLFENVSLTDGVKTWKGLTGTNALTENPYINIDYKAGDTVTTFDGSNYLQKTRDVYSTDTSKNSYSITQSKANREDMYGFVIWRREDSSAIRAPGLLKLTVAVKTIGKDITTKQSAVENVDVNINLVNALPQVFYNGKQVTGATEEVSVNMSMGKTETLKLESGTLTGSTGQPKSVFYSDSDRTDTMRFYVPSAYKAGVGGMTQQEIDYISSISEAFNGGASALSAYYGPNYKGLTSADKYEYEPNPNFTKFFSISPNNGSAKDLQFVPVAKTQPRLPRTTDDEIVAYNTYLRDNHLGIDANGKVYYPFRILFYDECNGSPFTEGWYYAVVIKVYIDNDPLTSTIQTKVTVPISGVATQIPLYKLSLSRGTTFYIDVSTLLSDNDIVLDKFGSFATEADGEYTKLEAEQKCRRDYFVMPAPNAYTAPDGTSITAALPITVEKGDGVSISATTLKFAAQKPFKDAVRLKYEFADACQAKAQIIFEIYYNNDAPVANADTFGQTDTFDVTMKTGNYFELYASDSTLFRGDGDGGFNSYKTAGGGYLNVTPATQSSANHVTFPLNATQQNAADMKTVFMANMSNPTAGIRRLGALVLGQDDAPSTLRITNFELANSDDSRMITVEKYGLDYKLENSNVVKPIALKVTANGAVSTTLAVTIQDGTPSGSATGITPEPKSIRVYIKITVTSSAPTPVTAQAQLPTGLTYDTDSAHHNTYKVSISLASEQQKTKKFRIGVGSQGEKGFMNDVDLDDTSNLRVYTGVDGSQFTITNPDINGTAIANQLVTARYVNEANIGYVELSAVDFIGMKNKTATVRFRIADAHGVFSEVVTFDVTIEPSEVQVVAYENNDYRKYRLMSYADYIAPSNGSRPVTYDIVALANNAQLFSDADVSSLSARYNVYVYALLAKVNDKIEGVEPEELIADASKLEAAKICQVAEGTFANGSGDIRDYVSNFFTIDISPDGKTISFTPRSATISPNSSNLDISSIAMYIKIEKKYEIDDNTHVMQAKYTRFAVAVENSAIVAVGNLPSNSGYPQVNNTPRDADFLEFYGTTGDKLTWNLYDTASPLRGLFYDWDMRNFPTGADGAGGKETITYIAGKYTVNETGVGKDKGSVLSVSVEGAGKDQKVTIAINRKVYLGAPPAAGFENKPTKIDVYIYVADTMVSRRRPSVTNPTATTGVVATVISVYVENDVPEFSKTGLVLACPVCGESAPEKIRQIDANTAQCDTNKHKFKSLDPERLGYSLEFSEVQGYVLNAKLEKDKALTVNIRDIINDADMDMDQFVMIDTGASNSLIGSSGEVATSIKLNDKQLFSVETRTLANAYGVPSSLYSLTFTCKSATRGAVGVATVKFRDSVNGAYTDVLTIYLTVDNVAPTLKANVNTDITIMGVGKNGTATDVAARSKSFNIIDFVTDVNGDSYNAADATAAGGRTPTFAFVDGINAFTSSSAYNKPTIYGPKYMETPEPTEEDPSPTPVATVDTACNVTWLETDTNHQSFTIEPFIGIYGVQKVEITVMDSGYLAGASAEVYDGKAFKFTLTITVANPLDDVTALEAKSMVFGVTRTVAATDLLGEENAKGYVITNIQEIDTDYLTITPPDSASGNINDWRIHADAENVSVKVRVTFMASGISQTRDLDINMVSNTPPTYKNGKQNYIYTTSALDNRDSRTIKIYPEQWFEDADKEDVMRFITPVSSSQSVIVEAVMANDGGRPYILLKFNRRGESKITVTLSDLSGRSYTREVTVNCTDAPELSWWESVLSYVEANPILFWSCCGGGLLFIILLIILIVIIHKKRKIRKEIEALLDSETELEAEMMRLSAGTAQYQSFGYLPPTQHNVMDPGLMLGGGTGAPVPNSLQLNAGTGAQPPRPNPQTIAQIPNPNAGNNVPPRTVNYQTTQIPPQQPAQQQPPVKPPFPTSGDGFNPDDF